jgi:hypothetical protein
MFPTRFIVRGGSAVDVLQERNRLLGCSNPIIEVLEDFGEGPLEDADHAVPRQRVAWWKALWRAQPWLNGDEGAAVLLKHYLGCRSHLLSSLAAPQPVVVWIGNMPHDRLMLAMVASLLAPRATLSVVDISGQVSAQYKGHWALGMCSPDSLLQLCPRQVEDDERSALREQWAYWKEHGRGWREIDASGHIVEYPLDHLDSLVCATATRMGPQPADLLVGEVMGSYPGMVSDGFLFWRLEVLRQEGRVIFTPAGGVRPQAPLVSMPT